MYTLYWSPGSASLCVHHALIELGVPHELRALDLSKGEQKTPAYLALNPNGVVPTLVVEGRAHYEAASLLMTLADRHPEAKLAPPPASPARAEYHQWMLHLANTVQPAYRIWFYPGEAIDDPTQHDAVKAAARKRIEAAWARIDEHLARSGGHMAGGAYSVADIYTTMLMRWSRNMPKPATTWANCKALADRVKARPAWATLYEREGLTEWR